MKIFDIDCKEYVYALDVDYEKDYEFTEDQAVEKLYERHIQGMEDYEILFLNNLKQKPIKTQLNELCSMFNYCIEE